MLVTAASENSTAKTPIATKVKTLVSAQEVSYSGEVSVGVFVKITLVGGNEVNTGSTIQAVKHQTLLGGTEYCSSSNVLKSKVVHLTRALEQSTGAVLAGKKVIPYNETLRVVVPSEIDINIDKEKVMVQVQNVTRKIGNTKRIVFRLNDKKGDIDISNFSLFKLSVNPSQYPRTDEATLETLSGFIIDGTKGVVGFTPTGTIPVGRYFYDAEYVDDNGEVLTFVEGSFIVEQGITK